MLVLIWSYKSIICTTSQHLSEAANLFSRTWIINLDVTFCVCVLPQLLLPWRTATCNFNLLDKYKADVTSFLNHISYKIINLWLDNVINFMLGMYFKSQNKICLYKLMTFIVSLFLHIYSKSLQEKCSEYVPFYLSPDTMQHKTIKWQFSNFSTVCQ